MNRNTTFMALCAIMALLSACAHKPPVVIEKRVIQYVETKVQCPPPEERERLRKLRPSKLRDQIMPLTVVERDAQSQAQLGQYEADGGYADQVDAALDRCQQK